MMFKTYYFQLCFLYKVTCAGKHMEINRIKHIQIKKNDNIFHIFDQIKVSRIPF